MLDLFAWMLLWIPLQPYKLGVGVAFVNPLLLVSGFNRLEFSLFLTVDWSSQFCNLFHPDHRHQLCA